MHSLQWIIPDNPDAPTIVIVPTQDIVITSAKLPKMPKSRLQQAIPYALEDQLVDDIENLHFAVGDYQEDGTVPVIIVAHKKMREWLEILEQENISPGIMIPSLFLVPPGQVNSDASISIARTGKYSGFACATDNLSTLLSEPLQNTHLSLQELCNRFSLQTFQVINLLQKPYQAKSTFLPAKKIWVLAGYLAAAWIGLVFFSHLISFFILHHEENRIEKAVNHIYSQHFHQSTTSVTSAKSAMEKKLRDLEQQANKNHFLMLLATVAKHLSQPSGIRLLSLEFQNNQLTLNLSANTFDRLDELTATLVQQGLHVKQESAAIAGAQVKATLLINAGGEA